MESDAISDDVVITSRSRGRLRRLRLRVDYSSRGTFIPDPDLKLNWTTYYRSARDGGKWILELQRGDRHLTASGRNAGPDSYSEFYRCLNQLVGGRLS